MPTLQRAQELFDLMNATSCDPCTVPPPCIPFLYPPDGCYARAHEMCRLMELEGEQPRKVFIYSSIWPLSGLVVETSNDHSCQVRWRYHVAPTLSVTTHGGPVDMVIDPSLCNGPVTLNDWKSIQGDPGATHDQVDASVYYKGRNQTTGQTDANYSKTNLALQEKRFLLKAECTKYGPPPYSCPIIKTSHIITDRNTFSESEIAAMIQASGSNPAEIAAAFYVVVDGFTPEELNITSATLSGVPNIKPNIAINPGIAQMRADPVALNVEDPHHLKRRQRLTWTYKITFAGTNGFNFAGDVKTVMLSESISTVTSSAAIYLIKQPNPYEIDGETSWLSTDLRVFKIEEGQSKFNATVGSDPGAFIRQVIMNLNTGNTGGQTFGNDISTNQQTSGLALYEKVGNKAIYNFAVARVRYRSLVAPAEDVRLFFRLIPWATTSVNYNQAAAYRRHASGGTTIPLLGLEGNRTSSIPCFASDRINSASDSMTTQTDDPNVQDIPADASGNEVVRYFGCWLDINQTQAQFPDQPSPVDGPYTSGRVSIQDRIRGEHQCLVAEIAFDHAPIQNGATPASSDKLAQRNLATYEAPNPGLTFSRRIPHTFEIRPSGSKLEHDEIMIDWGYVPEGSVATLYLPGIDTNDILSLATRKYRTHRLVRIDENTLKFDTGGITYLPIPIEEGSYPGLLTVDLPEGIEKGEVFKIVVRQVTSEQKPIEITHGLEAPRSGWRHIVGSFQLTISVRDKAVILPRQERLLSNLRWIERAIPATDRWSPVFSKYVTQIADRVDALGGDSKKVAASPSGEWRKAYKNCSILAGVTALLTSVLLVAIGMLTGGSMAIVIAPVFVLLIGAVYFWKKKCRPKVCQLLVALLGGAGVGAVILAVFALFAGATPQLVATFIAAAGVTAITAFLSWRMGCFRK